MNLLKHIAAYAFISTGLIAGVTVLAFMVAAANMHETLPAYLAQHEWLIKAIMLSLCWCGVICSVLFASLLWTMISDSREKRANAIKRTAVVKMKRSEARPSA